MVAGEEADSTGDADADGDAVELGSAAAIELALRQTWQVSAHKILFIKVINHHRIDGSRTKGGLPKRRIRPTLCEIAVDSPNATGATQKNGECDEENSCVFTVRRPEHAALGQHVI